ncbi:MAG: DUF4132 domain-containing protein [Lachnospiraceae bacterium]|nr:DUF4132 domain-containing protein [Lachnospiraceae bacterium]
MAVYDYRTRQAITECRNKELNEKVGRLSGQNYEIAKKLLSRNWIYVQDIYGNHPEKTKEKPSLWFSPKGIRQFTSSHQPLLNVFVPKAYQESYLYIIDKLNQFPFSRGMGRRCVRTADYRPQFQQIFSLLLSYEQLFFCGEKLENYMLRRLTEEQLDYVNHTYSFGHGFSYLYAAEIDRGNPKVIQAFKNLILSENNTAYLDREMILGILRSDNEELQDLLGKLLLAARLQEGLRQAVCESMDAGTPGAFLKLLKVVEDNNLIRFSSVKRAVSTWIGIYDENSVDRVNEKLLRLMGECLRDLDFCRKQLAGDDAVAINAALWALGFYEADDAVRAMGELVDHGTKNQRLSASFYNLCLYDEQLKLQTAKKAVLAHSDDLELAAAFVPAFSSRISSWVREAFQTGLLYGLRTPKTPVLTDYYENRREAEALYTHFREICDHLPKKGVCYDPFVFPWLRIELKPSDVLCQMAFLAWLLQDEEKITDMSERLAEIADGDLRMNLMNLLLYEPSNSRQRAMIIEYMGNAHTRTSEQAIRIVKKMELRDEEYALLEDMLRFRRGNLRGTLIDFLMRQPDALMKNCLRRLLTDKKEEKRSAGLDLLLRLSKNPDRAGLYLQIKGMTELVAEPTDKEMIVIKELKKESGENAAEKKGYGLYDPEDPEELLVPAPETAAPDSKELVHTCLPISEKEARALIQKMDRLFLTHKDYEYVASNGETCLLGNDFRCTKDWDYGKNMGGRYDSLEYYPLADLLLKFYQEEIKDYRCLMVIEAVLMQTSAGALNASACYYWQVFGRMPLTPAPLGVQYLSQVRDLGLVYRKQFLDKKLLFEVGLSVVSALLPFVDTEKKKITYQVSGFNGRLYDQERPICELPLFSRYFEGLKYWETDEEFRKVFPLAWKFEQKCREGRRRRDFVPARSSGYPGETLTGICPYWFLKAYHMGLISENNLCRAIMEYFSREDCLSVLCKVVKGEGVKPLNGRIMNLFFGNALANEIYKTGENWFAEDTWVGALIRKLYDKIVPVLVDTELRRGEAETEFSWDMRGVVYICGVEYLARILMALGKDPLDRNSYYGWYYGVPKMTRREVLSGLLKACYPASSETGADLRAAVKGARIQEERFVEVAMYAPQWVDLIQEYLGWAGLKSGCYYFMAHMNERFDDQKKAVIARYTPLTPEELQDGAFDVSWFEEAYELLGEKNFTRLYRAAKYISDGQKHSRARKYADAASGKAALSDLASEITAKRNKDLLMSYGLVPFRKDREQDMLERYQFIEQYRKESRQFGAQRRASEGKAADIALVNLSVRAGYEDVTRLKLTMEARLIEAMASLTEWTAVEDVELCLSVDEEGKSKIRCRKDGKELKSVPSRLGKQPHVLRLKEAHKNLKEQYARTRKMMEESMESGALFRASELLALFGNPVVRAILTPLVFLRGEQAGFLKAGAQLCLETPDGTNVLLEGGEEFRIAHPLDLYQSGSWPLYQKYLFDQRIRQPFKQVFRELYVKLPEELGLTASRMFAGNQIQPRKTAGCLKGRRWVADYEEGLQKVYYKENIVARIYALADWFSPSDIEAPTLEWVEFLNRKTFQPLTIEEVPDLIYSEVMRDVDLAVSVAHAGGVDPETSHSTIEMRRMIMELNLSLFGLTNVTLTDSHALIKGARASYNVHLGSGVVHQEGGAMLSILPVHSQKRGRIFLPFVDEDPKTAEIFSKIVLLAEDQKIKDPSILSQIH